MSKNVFVSYSRRDLDFVEKLVADLREKGLNVWYDYHLLSGEDWDDSLENQIHACDTFIVVLSKASVASDNVKNEVRFAMDLGKRIHPILLEECSVPLSMRRLHYIDFSKLEYDEAIIRVTTDITNENKKERINDLREGKSKRPTLTTPIIALAAVLVVSLLVWQFWPGFKADVVDDSVNTDKEEQLIIDDINWRKIQNSKELEDYLNYINNNENNEGRLDDAVMAVQNLLKKKGVIIMNSENIYDWFSKAVYKNSDRYVINKPAENNTEWPTKGDLLVARKRLTILDPRTFDVIGGVFLHAGDVIQFNESNTNNNSLVINFFYNPTTKEQ